ncbi:MAG: TonB-dependent receptor, partial [Myxococcales bacterium]|nr:TonB-dependent receptor [Myxococcales bacterium]
KLNYAEGFRPPELQSVGINPAGVSSVSFQSDPNLNVERSRAAEAEINAVLLENTGPLKRIYLRGDYAYSVLSDLVRNVGGRFANSGDRGIHSVEFLVRSEFKGEHELWLGGHHVRAEDSIIGPVRNFPNWVFMGGGRLSLLDGLLELSALATFVGPQEDLNRAADVGGQVAGFAASNASHIEVDRVDPYLLLRLGVRLVGLWRDRIDVSAFVYNAADVRRVDPDFFFDDRVQSRPQPREGFSALGRVGVRF